MKTLTVQDMKPGIKYLALGVWGDLKPGMGLQLSGAGDVLYLQSQWSGIARNFLSPGLIKLPIHVDPVWLEQRKAELETELKNLESL